MKSTLNLKQAKEMKKVNIRAEIIEIEYRKTVENDKNNN